MYCDIIIKIWCELNKSSENESISIGIQMNIARIGCVSWSQGTTNWNDTAIAIYQYQIEWSKLQKLKKHLTSFNAQIKPIIHM